VPGVDAGPAADSPHGARLSRSAPRPDYLTLGAFETDREEPLEEPIPAENGTRTVDSEWEFAIEPYLWMTSLRTSVDAGPVSASSEVCFTDLIKSLDLGMQLRFEAVRGPWGFYLDGTYFSLSNDTNVKVGPFRLRGLDIDLELDQAFVDFGGFYRFQEEDWKLDLMFGGRYSYVASEVSGAVLLDIDSSIDFVSPIIGLRVIHELSDRWVASAWGNLGGFGLGDAPDLFWGATALLGYRYSDNTTLGLGYRIYASDFDFGVLKTDVQMHGPIVGLAFRF
jgi:hypothetical protein